MQCAFYIKYKTMNIYKGKTFYIKSSFVIYINLNETKKEHIYSCLIHIYQSKSSVNDTNIENFEYFILYANSYYSLSF